MKANPTGIRSSYLWVMPLVKGLTAATLLLNAFASATADTRIRGEFEYNLDDQALSEWQIGPIFLITILGWV